MNQDIQTRVIAIIAKTQKIPENSIQLDQTIQELCPHSLDLVNLIFDFEDEFNISILDEEIKELKTVQDIITGIERLLAKTNVVESA